MGSILRGERDSQSPGLRLGLALAFAGDAESAEGAIKRHRRGRDVDGPGIGTLGVTVFPMPPAQTQGLGEGFGDAPLRKGL